MNFLKSFTDVFIEKKKDIISKIKTLFQSDKLYSDYISSLRDILIESDVGLETADKIIDLLKSKGNFKSSDDIKFFLFEILDNILISCQSNIELDVFPKPFVLLVCGVNGVGKTTTVAKIANLYKNLGKKVAVVAGDTYRAAAIEQLSIICEFNMIPIIKQHQGADSASVVYDALLLAKRSNMDLLVIDTSGRLHVNNFLMFDLRKIQNVVKKINVSAPHEVLFVVDVNYGQNTLNQMTKFKENINVSGVCFTKFDGTSKGGIVFNLAHKFKIPIRYICFGEKICDIDFFNSKIFLNKLLSCPFKSIVFKTLFFF